MILFCDIVHSQLIDCYFDSHSDSDAAHLRLLSVTDELAAAQRSLADMRADSNAKDKMIAASAEAASNRMDAPVSSTLPSFSSSSSFAASSHVSESEPLVPENTPSSSSSSRSVVALLTEWQDRVAALEAEKHALAQQLERMLLAQQAVVVSSSLSVSSLSSLDDDAADASSRLSQTRSPSAAAVRKSSSATAVAANADHDDEHASDSDAVDDDMSRRHRELELERTLARRAAELDERAAALQHQYDALSARASDLDESGTCQTRQ